MTRLAGLALALSLLLTGAPARAQGREAFVEALIQFVDAADGEFGDEGRYVLAAVDAMARALAGWDAALAVTETAMTAEAAAAPPAEAARLRLAIAAIEIERGRFERALGQLDQAATLAPRSADVYLLKGLALDRLGRDDAATAAYRDAWQRAPETLAAAYRVALAPGSSPEAQAVGEAAVEVLSAAVKNRQAGGRLVFPADALLDDTAAHAPLLPLARYAPAFALLAQGRYDEAIDALRAAAAADPLVRAPSDVAAAAGALRAGDAAGCIERLTAVAALPSAPAEAHRVLALAWRASGDTAKAVAELRAAVALDPSDERARLALGDARAQMPVSLRARWQVGQAAIAAGDWAGAVEALEPMAASRPLAGASLLYAALARAYEARADPERAVRVLRAWVEATPQSSAAHTELGEALRAAGRAAEAEVERLAAELLK